MQPSPPTKKPTAVPLQARLAREERARRVLEGMLGDRARKLAEANRSLTAELEERKRLEEQLVQAQKLEAMGQLAAGVAHEINTPIQFIGDNLRFLREAGEGLLAVVSEYARLVERARSAPLEDRDTEPLEALEAEVDLAFLLEELPRAVEDGLQGVERVARIVRGMKTLSHPGEDRLRPFDLNAALRTTVDVARHEWKYVAEVRFDLDPRLPQVEGDAAALNQAFLNLLVNASHAVAAAVKTKGGRGRILVGTRRRGSEVQVRVSDSGVGIPDDVRARVFDPFFTTKSVGKGTGQGLSVTHAVVVQKHGGRIELRSTVGKGTTFLITLPIRHSKPSAEAA